MTQGQKLMDYAKMENFTDFGSNSVVRQTKINGKYHATKLRHFEQFSNTVCQVEKLKKQA